jgi:hypothetical protein
MLRSIMPILEGRWDCSQCRTKGILGRELNCTECGDPRNPLLDPEEKPYLPDDAEIVVDDLSVQLAKSGPNWNCGNCGEANIGTNRYCRICEQPLDTNDDVHAEHTYVSGVDVEKYAVISDPGSIDDDRVDAVLQQADKLQPLADGPVRMPNRTLHASSLPRRSAYALRRAAAQSTRAWPPSLTSSSQMRNIVIAATVLVFAFVCAVTTYLTLFKTTEVELTVQSLSWERQVEVEAYRTLTLQDWSLPSDARVVSSERTSHPPLQSSSRSL